MRNFRTLVPVWLIATGVLFFGYSNCSKIAFDTSPALLQQQLLEFNSTSSITINGGAPYTNNSLVQLSLYSPRGMQMKISNLADCSDGTWEPYDTAKAWTLSKTDTQVSVYVLYQDLRGDVSTCSAAAIIHDDIAPTANFTSPQGLITNNSSVIVQWSAQDNLSGIDSTTCTAPGAAASTCSLQLPVTTNAEGNNSLTISVKDKAGNVSQNYVYSWLLDKTPPVVSINAQPAALTGSGTAALSFTATDSGSGVDKLFCSLDGAAASACTSPANYSGLTAGAHSFQVYATDKAGNASGKMAANWVVDMTAPTIQFTQTPPAYSNSATNTFAFTGTKNGAPITKFECATDAAAFASCASPVNLNGVTEGKHTFSFRGIDDLGNVSSPLAYNWVVDTTAPIVTITSGPLALNNMTQANLAWTATDSLSGIKMVECRLDGATYQACNLNSMAYTNLVAGPHSFNVRATDNSGNQTVATRNWTIDLTAPVVTISSGPAAFVNSLSAKFTFSATDASGVAGYECKVDNNTYATCTSPNTTSNLNEGGHIFYVRATDNAGNVSVAATQAWTLDLSPPIIRIISSPAALKDGDHAIIQYQILDSASGVASVQCGLTSPSGSVQTCPTANTLDLGTMTVGKYVFTITATDNVGNTLTDTVPFEVTTSVIICDPFTPGSDATCSGGLIGDIYYLPAALQTKFEALATKTVDYYYTNGTKVNAILNLKQLFVSTRSFSTGFPTSTGALIQDNTGSPLYSYFAFHLNTVLKLDALNDTAGWYQFATLSDDGSMVLMTPQPASPAQTLIANDGDHSTEMGCSPQAIYVDDTTRLGMEIKYYQGPPTEIALVLMWRKVSGPTAALDALCGTSGNNQFFGAPPYTDFTNGGFGTLLKNGWRVIAPANFIAPPTN